MGNGAALNADVPVIIIDKNAKNSMKIVNKITELYNDLSVVAISDIDEAVKVIKSEKPHLVFATSLSHIQ